MGAGGAEVAGAPRGNVRLIFAGLAGLLLYVPPGAGSTYLPVLGPAPLRFLTEHTLLASVALASLPPLVLHETAPVKPAPATAASTAPSANLGQEPWMELFPNLPAPAPAIVTAPEPATSGVAATNVVSGVTGAPPAPVLSQLLQAFFSRQIGASNQATTVIAPVEFSPPQPAGTRSSTTSFIQPP